MRRSARGPAVLFVLAAACSPSGGGGGPAGSDGAAGPGQDSGATEGGPTPPLSQPEQGIATYYAADGTGNCGFDATPNDLMVAAMDAAEYAGSAACGECVTIQGPTGSVTVRIVDQCPGCEKGHLDLSQEAFAKIADVSLGRVPITWTVVACSVTGPIAYRFKEGSSQYWTAIQVRNSKLPISKLEWKAGGGAYADIPRLSYNYFVIASGVGTTGSFMVRVTAEDGQTLEDSLPGVQPTTVVNGVAQFN